MIKKLSGLLGALFLVGCGVQFSRLNEEPYPSGKKW